jgi:hypothetical protein
MEVPAFQPSPKATADAVAGMTTRLLRNRRGGLAKHEKEKNNKIPLSFIKDNYKNKKYFFFLF